MQNGKGGAPRPKDWRKWDNGFDHIVWGKPTKDKKQDKKQDKKDKEQKDGEER